MVFDRSLSRRKLLILHYAKADKTVKNAGLGHNLGTVAVGGLVDVLRGSPISSEERPWSVFLDFRWWGSGRVWNRNGGANLEG